MEAELTLVRYYSSSRSAEAANLCSTSHLILRGSAPKRSRMLASAAGNLIVRLKSSKSHLNCRIYEFLAKPMEAELTLLRYYSSSRSAEAASLCSTSHLILRGSAPKRSKMLAWGAAESTFQRKSSKTDIFKISPLGLWATSD